MKLLKVRDYKISADHEQLFSFLLEGYQAYCFAYIDRTDIKKVISTCYFNKEDKSIVINIPDDEEQGCEMSYTPEYHDLYKAGFLSECRRLNLEWIEP